MSMNPLNLYVKLSRLVFSVDPTEKWEDYDEFEEDFMQLYNSILCASCNKLLLTPVIPKKNHFSCQHRVCLDCIGRKRSSYVDCQMCNDYTLFEKSSSTKLVLDCFQELCELIHGSWIYEYIKKHQLKKDSSGKDTNLIEVIESGMNYGKVSIVIDDTSSDESSCSSESVVELIAQSTPLKSHKQIPEKSSPSPVKTCTNLVQSTPEQISINEPVITAVSTPQPPRPPLVQFSVQSQMPSTSKLLPSSSSSMSNQQSFIKYASHQPVRLASPVKSIMTPMKLQTAPSTPQIYSVMYTGTGNKITLKRKPPEEASPPPSATSIPAISNTLPQIVQSSINPVQVPVAVPINPVNPITNNTSASTMTTTLKTDNVMKQHSNVIPTPVTTNQLVNPSNNEKRRGCRCGNATAAPGKLTCCGQRCPCYVDSKACIDCKCRGCRNPHFIDGHKKMRHPVPDQKTQQQQQQNFLASMQQQVVIKDKPPMTVIPSTSDLTMNNIDKTTLTTCLIGNGYPQIAQMKTTPQPRIIMKDQIRTLNPMMFNTSSQGIHHQSTAVATSIASNSNIQIVGLYSQLPMMGDSNISNKKIIIKNDQTASSVVSFSETTKQHFETTTANFTANNLNTNLL